MTTDPLPTVHRALDQLADQVLVLPLAPQTRRTLIGVFRQLRTRLDPPSPLARDLIQRIAGCADPAWIQTLVSQLLRLTAVTAAGTHTGREDLTTAADLLTMALVLQRSSLGTAAARHVRDQAPLTKVSATARRSAMLRKLERIVSQFPPGPEDGAPRGEVTTSGPPRATRSPRTFVKVVISGCRASQRALLASMSDTEPVRMPAPVAFGEDDADAPVEIEAGQLTLDSDLVLHLNCLPDPAQSAGVWDALNDRALGAVVLVDPEQVEDSFAAIDYFEAAGFPFAVGVDTHSASAPRCERIRDALAVADHVPLLASDTTDAWSCRALVRALVEHAIERVDPATTTARGLTPEPSEAPQPEGPAARASRARVVQSCPQLNEEC